MDIHPLKGYLVFCVTNSVDHDVLKENPHLLTTKEDADSHGLGLRIIRRIVKQNDGILHFQMDGPDRFSAQVMLRI